jgi:hypothetical protein
MWEHVMSEHNQHEVDRHSTLRPNPRRRRDSDGLHPLEQLDQVQQAAHRTERGPRARRDTFPKDDRRSSTLLTERERSERWPLG